MSNTIQNNKFNLAQLPYTLALYDDDCILVLTYPNDNIAKTIDVKSFASNMSTILELSEYTKTHVYNPTITVTQDNVVKGSFTLNLPNDYTLQLDGVEAGIPSSYYKYDETKQSLSIDGYLATLQAMQSFFDFGNGDVSALNLNELVRELEITNVLQGKLPIYILLGHNVLSVGKPTDLYGVFKEYNSLTGISMPDVVYVNDNGFIGCMGLKHVSMPNALAIGRSAFAYCTMLSSIGLPNALSIGIRAFANCSKLSSISIPNAVRIDDGAFSSTRINSIAFPDSLTCIGNNLFYGGQLTSVLLGPNLASIGSEAFSPLDQDNPLEVIYVREKTLAEAEAMLSNVGIPSGCRIVGLLDFITNWKPAYTLIFENTLLTGKVRYYPTICEEECPYLICWRLNYINHSNGIDYKIGLQDINNLYISGVALAGGVHGALDWPYDNINGSLSINNGNANVDIFLEGYINEYPNICDYNFASVDMSNFNFNRYQNAKRIGAMAFHHCYNISNSWKNLYFPLLEKIGWDAFMGNVEIQSINAPMLTCIEYGAFSGSALQISSINCPNLKLIGNIYGSMVFYNLKQLVLSNIISYDDIPSVFFSTSYGNGTFWPLTSEVSVYIAPNMTNEFRRQNGWNSFEQNGTVKFIEVTD